MKHAQDVARKCWPVIFIYVEDVEKGRTWAPVTPWYVLRVVLHEMQNAAMKSRFPVVCNMAPHVNITTTESTRIAQTQAIGHNRFVLG